MSSVKRGSGAELAAAAYLEGRGVRILEHNYRTGRAEIDLIGICGGVLIFFEVKYRSTVHAGEAAASVTPAKQKRICGCALHYLWKKGLGTDHPVRFDVVAIQQKDILWIQDAFPFRAPGNRRTF